MPGRPRNGTARRRFGFRRQGAAAAHRRLLPRVHHELVDQGLVPETVRGDTQFARRDAELHQHVVEATQVPLEVVGRIAHVRLRPRRHRLSVLDGGNALQRVQRHKALAAVFGALPDPDIAIRLPLALRQAVDSKGTMQAFGRSITDSLRRRPNARISRNEAPTYES